MEPHLFRCGKCEERNYYSNTNPASMEPHLFRCGKPAGIWVTGPFLKASMEPHLFRCGKISAASSAFFASCVLQWSHIFSDVVST